MIATAPDHAEHAERVYPWKTTEAPRDRAIWIRANLINKIYAFTEVDHYEGYAEFRHEGDFEDWLDLQRLSIRRMLDTEIVVREWIELAERAKDCPPEETSLDANVYYFDASRTTVDLQGYHAIFTAWHSPTRERLADRREGPFATRAEAVRVLIGMIEESETKGAA